MSHYIVLLIGRFLFSLIFIINGISHFTPQTIHYAAYMGVPAPTVLVPIAGIIVFLGALTILLGYKGRLGAWILAVFLLVTAFGIHRFWQAPDAHGSIMHHFCFWKNISLIGAALMVTYFGTGPYSLDNYFIRKNKKR